MKKVSMRRIAVKSSFWFAATFGASSCGDFNVQDAVQLGSVLAGSSINGVPSTEDYIQGVKETLALSGTRASSDLSKAGGFSDSALYKISGPEDIQKISGTLRTFGLGKQVDTLESHMNKGAELAAAEAKGVFIDAVKQMSVSDALGILQGGENAATNYFKATTEQTLRARYAPIVEQQLSKVGFYNDFKQFQSLYQTLPINNKPSLDLESHVVDKSLTAIFSQLSKEEAKIRQDPLGQGTQFLNKIFTAARNTAQ